MAHTEPTVSLKKYAGYVKETCQNHQGQISFMLHQHDVVLMLKVRMSGSCTVSRLSSLAAVQHHLKMQI